MYEAYTHLKLERRGAVLTVTLDNPPTNAASLGIHRELSTIFEDIARDDETRVVVVTGAGSRAFSAGGDIDVMIDQLSNVESLRVQMAEAHRLLYRSKIGLDAAREVLRGNERLVPQVNHLLSFIEGQQEGRHGRGREIRRAA